MANNCTTPLHATLQLAETMELLWAMLTVIVSSSFGKLHTRLHTITLGWTHGQRAHKLLFPLPSFLKVAQHLPE